MSDAEEIDLGESGGESGGEGGDGGKKGKGLGGLLPTLLKFVGIGLAALLLIVTVAVFTFNIMNKSGKTQTAIPQTEAYVAVKPVYSAFTLIGDVNARTKDAVPWNVVVNLIIQYDLNDTATNGELIARQYELRDFIRRYFSGKYAADLRPEKEAQLKQEIREQLNTQVFDKARAREILFDKLDIMEGM
ncbi:MAG: flagellar basal body-associated FliL family protein [Spirochaetaceae bacterium]|jgi:flagellar FliL protein|nr:flagellar basal body-associated FliL family protein [Spirochaetaceae bacterium]